MKYSARSARGLGRTGRAGRRGGGGIGGMFWRFLVAADETVDRFIVRDSDSRLNTRERLAVEEWVQSGKAVHSIRDHPNHDRPLNGGMWGGTRAAVPDMRELVQKWSNRDKYMGDLDFLNKQVWPREAVQKSQIAHDAYSCDKYPNSRPFPTRRPSDYQHVGQARPLRRALRFSPATPRVTLRRLRPALSTALADVRSSSAMAGRG